ncbi:hypothetical protein BC835DRAFT_757502 [Cytidiella melzeri]|nr:hypothetical protein BC835DRAFT_757502 [Cytidiella melzeri]
MSQSTARNTSICTLFIVILVICNFSASSTFSFAQKIQDHRAAKTPARREDSSAVLDYETGVNWSNFKVRVAHSVGAGCLYSLRMWRSRRAASLSESQYNMPY